MQDNQPKPSRRGFVFGAATAGAAAAAVVALPKVQDAVAEAPGLKEPPANGGGYQLTEHVKRYYRTTLV
ncbi:MAG: twin-arginine translocation signal domain-containing protein [Ramlibacter sp.]